MAVFTKKQIFAILISVGVLVLLFFVPQKPADSEQKKESTVASDAHNHQSEIQQAIEMVTSGSNPMEGILTIRKIANEHPDNPEPQYYLGVFSIQSGQFDKAVERFSNVLSLNDKEYVDAYYYLGLSYKQLGDKEQALNNFKKYVSLGSGELIPEAQKNINELK